MIKKTHIAIIACLVLAILGLAATMATRIFLDRHPTSHGPVEQSTSPIPAEAATGKLTATGELTAAEKEEQYEQFIQWLDTESAKPDDTLSTETTQYNDPIPTNQQTDEITTDTSDTPAQDTSSSQSLPTWQTIWADLNLTEAEQVRLRQGFGLAIQRWMQMPPEEQAAERARMQSMRTRWEAMDDDEKAHTSQRIRDRFEDWRQSGAVELPELSLD